MLIFDAHLDLAMNAVEWNRDLTRPVAEIRASEAPMSDKADRCHGAVALPEMRRGRIGVCVATLIARVEHDAFSPVQGWRSQAQAWSMTQAQRAWYGCMEEAGQMRLVHDAESLEQQLAAVDAGGDAANGRSDWPVGFVLSLEGADSLVSLDHLHRLHAGGLRAVGPAHYGPGVYAFGTDSDGHLNEKGRTLLGEMGRLGMILDVTHLSETCFWDAIEQYEGPLWASHQNCRALVPGERQFSDEQLKVLIERGAVIGAALDAWMLAPGWIRGETTPEQANVTLETVADHIDHVCQLAGNAEHSGIGSDLDGAFGTEQMPRDLDTVADLPGILECLRKRGYASEAIERIASGNFVGFLRRAWQ